MISPEWITVVLTLGIQLVGFGRLKERVDNHGKTLEDHEDRIRDGERGKWHESESRVNVHAKAHSAHGD